MDTSSWEAWPVSLRNFTTEAFTRCKTPADQDKMENILEIMLKRAFENGTVLKIDWSKQKLPDLNKPYSFPPDLLNSTTNTVSSSTTVKGNYNSMSKKQQRQQFQSSRSRSPSSSYDARSQSRSKAKRELSSSMRRNRHNDDRNRSRNRSRSRSPAGNGSPGRSHERSRSRTKKRRADHSANGRVNYRSRSRSLSPTRRPVSQQVQRERSPSTVGPHDRSRSLIANDITSSKFFELEQAIVGTCQNLEKQYLRLTSAPDPSTVRPIDVLKRSLERIVNYWRTATKNRDNYHYTCDQLKSIRQDLTVQFIRNYFTVHVYEIHARIALEVADQEEFNQCQSQLKTLYEIAPSDDQYEFLGYLILYLIYTENTSELQQTLSRLPCDSYKHPVVDHALKVRRAWSLGNYHKFFLLYKNAPALSAKVMDWFIDRERRQAIKMIMKSYKPNVTIEFLNEQLAFSNIDDCQKFANQHAQNYELRQQQQEV